MAAISMNENDLFWVPDDQDVWTLASQSGVILPNGLVSFVVHKTKKVVALPKEKCLPAVKDQGTPEDLIQLPDVNPASILACVRARFQDQKIYTSIGMVLMSINPFRLINGLYGKQVIKQYEDPMAKNLSAHVYMVPARAYYDMCVSGRDQSILISGESGAGKTEATKQCLNFLTEVANQAMQHASSSVHRNESSVSIADISERIIAASPILEAFGNAQTLRNPNSSRFGKWMILNFDRNNVIHSSNIISYLLEKSRVTQRDTKERSYHVFYQILRGIGREQLISWHIDPSTRAHRYLSQGTNEAPDLNDSKLYKETYQAFLKMGFSNDDILHLFKIVMAVLLLGDVVFNPTKDGEGSSVGNHDVVEQIAKKLGVSQEILTYALCNRSIESGKAAKKSVVAVQLSVQKAQETRDSLARHIYDKVFLDIIATINQKSKDNTATDMSLADRGIGLLDIFGFEIFVENSFEQLCINYCNEMLQNHFNFVIFTAEKNLYNQEGVTCETIEFRDNIEVIKEIEGAFKALDEESRIPKGNSKTWFDKLKRSSKMNHIGFPTRRQGDIFAVRHYAGNVDYISGGFLEKNIETLNNDLLGAMSSSSDTVVHRMFSSTYQHGDAPPDRRPSTLAPASLKETFSTANMSSVDLSPMKDAGGARGRSNASTLSSKSLSWRFINQLSALMTMLKRTKSHFIRCIKSNDDCAAQRFESSVVYKQLVYSGVFEVVKIQQSGLPCRLIHDEFMVRYRCLAPSDMRFVLRSPSELISCLTKQKFDLQYTRIGSTMTFYKSQEQRVLEARRDALLRYGAITIVRFMQMKTRSYLYKHLLQKYKQFNYFNTELDLQNATEAFDSFVSYCTRMHKLVRFEILAHAILALERELNLLDRRVQLILDAKEALGVRTKEGVDGLEQIVSRAIDLEITSHAKIVECKSVIQKYYRTIEFVSIVHSTVEDNAGKRRSSVSVSALTVLTSEQIAEGLELLAEMNDLVPDAAEALDDVARYKNEVDIEIEERLRPLERLFHQSSIFFDAKTGNIAYKSGVEGQMAFTKLHKMIEALEHEEFKCLDMKVLFEDCDVFITMMEEHVVFNDAQNGLDLIQSATLNRGVSKVFSTMCEEFRMWAEIQLSADSLRRLLTQGSIVSSASIPYEVNCDEIERLVDKLKALTEPTENIQMVIRVGYWVVKLRKAFLASDWDLLEETVCQADQDGVDNFIFDDFPDCIEELNSCQWQVIYHGFYGDLVFAITEPVFRLITFETESYFILVSNLEEELAMIEDIKGFASTESSPKLLDLVPLLEKIIQLRSLVYSREIEFARALMQDINVSMGEIIKAFFFTDSMQEEMIACEKLLKKMEYEKLLDIALNNHLCKPYDFADENEQLKYTANVSLTAGIVLLQDVLQNLSILSASFDSNLQAKINVGNILLSGRKYLQMDETDVHTPWQDYHKSFESSVEGLKDDENNMYANYEGEFEVILHEMQRRSLLHGCCIILHAIVVDGRVDIDVHVESSVLSDLFHKFNHVILCLKRKYEQYPVNLQNLAKFTKEMLKFRKYLNDFHDKWDLNIVDKILGKLQTMKHGGGMNIENVRREMVLMEKEIDARRNTNQLKHELQFLPLNVSDSSTQVSLLVNSEPLTQAIEKAKPNQGHMSKKLVALAVSVITMLKHLQQNETDKIDINSMEDIATRYQTFQLDVSNINIVFNRVRIYNFLKSLNEALVTHKDKPESLLQIINKVKASLKNLPAKFIPWLHTAYLYCYLSDALHRKSWIEIIEVAQELDEYINSELKETLVSMQQENTAFDNNFSDAEKFLSVCTEYKLHGFYKAIEMKTEQDTSELYKQSVHLSPIDSLKAQIRHDDLCKNMYGVGALRNASYSDAEIAKLNFPPKILWAYNFECSLLRKVNYPANQLLEAGFPLEDLYRSGYKILELYHNGVTISQLLRLGLTVSQLRQAGITNEELLQSQDIPIAEVKDLENEPKKLFKLGYTLPELVQAGFTVSELRGAGFSATEIYHAGLRNVQDFIAAGFSSSRLTAVFPLKQLAASGSLSYSELKYAGVSELDLLQAGFEVDVEKRALMVIYQKLAGARWRYQVHWNSNKPLKQWYGIATQPDARQVERVVSIDLVDNNLQGDLPEELGLFLCLRRLRLSGNARLNLTSIPDPLLKLIQQNKIVNDIIPYNSVNKILSRTMSFNHGYSNLLSPVKTQDPTNTSVNNLSIDIPLSSTPVVKGNNSNVMQALSSVHSMFALNPDENKDGERDALVEIYRALRGQKWKNSANWCSAAPVSSWFGVSVNREGYVIALILPSNNLKGCLPDAVGSLRYLEELDLRLNQISGLIPHGLAYCFSLKKLYLQTNKLSGSIPNGIEELTDLIVLDLRSNSLQGEPPCNALKNLPNLRYLGLYSNLLTVNRQQLLQILPSCKIVL